MKTASNFNGTDSFTEVPKEDNNWHSIVVYVKDGKKTTYIDGKKVND